MAASQKNARADVCFVFIDESGFSEGAVIRRTWAPRGQTPVLRPKLRSWRRASAIGAVGYRRSGQARIFLKLHRGEVRAKQVLQFLRHLLRHIPGKVIVLWDGLSAHRAVLVREWISGQARLRVVRLPAYAPELNPVEGLWAWAKGTLLANVCEDHLEPITERVRCGIRNARQRPALIWGFLEKAGLFL